MGGAKREGGARELGNCTSAHTVASRPTGRQTDGQAGRWMDRQTNTDRETDRQMRLFYN